MKTKFFLFHILVLCVVFGIPANLWADDAGTQVSKIRVLEPGEAERCANNFFVEVFIDKILQPGEKRAFNLPATINVARFQGREDLTFDDVAVIINLGPKSHMRVRCIKLRDNPLRGKDPLATFK